MKRPSALLFRFHSIRTSILISFTALIIGALAIFMIFSVRFTQNAVVANSGDYTQRLVDQLNTDIDSYISYMENISQLVNGGTDVNSFLFGTDEATREAAGKSLADQFAVIMSTRSDICNIGVCGTDGTYLINTEETRINAYSSVTRMEWYLRTVEADGEAVVSSSHVQNIVQDSYTWVVTLSRALKDPKTGEIAGIFFIDLNYSAISGLCENLTLGTKGYLFILDRDGDIVYHPWQQLLYNNLKTERIREVMSSTDGSFTTSEGDQSKLYTVSRSEKTGWTIVGVAYVEELMENRDEMQNMYFLAAVVLFAAAFVFAALLSSGISRPVTTLKNSMKEVEQGHFDNVYIPVEGENELSSLNNSFNIMTERIRRLMEENVREQREKRRSELQALQAQITPHFLYNTLDSIIWMAEWGKNKEVVTMTSSLAKLFRQSISNEKEFVTVGEEIEYTRSYLTIQEMRYRDQLSYEIDVDEGVCGVTMVKLVVQPLVENAIYHSIKYMEGRGLIRITGCRDGSDVTLFVSDNGVGMDAETLAHILEEKPAEPGKRRHGVGVYNVHNRLQLHYGRAYGLSYESEPGRGTRVTIRIPYAETEREGGCGK